MRIMIDTNVIISAVLFPQGRAAQAFMKSVSAPYRSPFMDNIYANATVAYKRRRE